MKGRLRVIHVGHGGGTWNDGVPSGIGRIIVDLIMTHDSKHFEPSAVFFGVNGGGAQGAISALQRRGCRYYNIEWLSKWNPAAYVKGACRLLKILRKECPDAVILHGYWPILLGAKIARYTGIPVILGVDHGPQKTFLRLKKTFFLLSQAPSFIDEIIFVSKSTQEEAYRTGLYGERYGIVIENGINLDLYTKVTSRELRKPPYIITMVSRLDTPSKDPHTLVRALRLLLDHNLPVRVRFVGDGNARADVERLASDLGVAEFVEFTGQVNNVIEYLKTSDVFCLSTRFEGLPTALIEAMAIGLPVVASKVEGVIDVVEDRKNGLLVPPEDPNALANALVWLLTNPEAAREMGHLARSECTRRFDRRRMTAQYEELIVSTYQKAVANRNKKRASGD